MLTLEVLLEPNRQLVNNLNALARQMASGELEREIEVSMAETALPLIVELTPEITGSWRSAWAIYSEDDYAEISIAPEAINPLSPERPFTYAPKVHNMGGVSRSGHVRSVLDVFLSQHSEEVFAAGEDAAYLSLDVFA